MYETTDAMLARLKRPLHKRGEDGLPLRYVCKRCGAESPAGIGYVATVVAPVPAAGCPGPHLVERSELYGTRNS